MNKKFYNKAREALGGLYVWGGQGHAATEAYIRGRARNYPEYFTHGRLDMMLNRAKENPALRCWDCSGLVNWALDEVGLVRDGFDTTAAGLYANYCTPVKKEDLILGDLLFRKGSKGIVHVGIYAPGACLEAAGGEYGVVECKGLSGNDHIAYSFTDKKYARLPNWTHYGRLKVLGGKSVGSAGGNVEVIGGAVYIRDAPDTSGKILKVARRGETYRLLGKATTGWYEIDADGAKGFISNKAGLTRVV